jgi:hypothetical protein
LLCHPCFRSTPFSLWKAPTSRARLLAVYATVVDHAVIKHLFVGGFVFSAQGLFADVGDFDFLWLGSKVGCRLGDYIFVRGRGVHYAGDKGRATGQQQTASNGDKNNGAMGFMRVSFLELGFARRFCWILLRKKWK